MWPHLLKFTGRNGVGKTFYPGPISEMFWEDLSIRYATGIFGTKVYFAKDNFIYLIYVFITDCPDCLFFYIC